MQEKLIEFQRYFCFWLFEGLRILSFPCNQFGSQMPEQNGEEMVCHLKAAGADVGDVFAKVIIFIFYYHISMLLKFFFFFYTTNSD